MRRPRYDPNGVCSECGGESKRCTVCCCCETRAIAELEVVALQAQLEEMTGWRDEALAELQEWESGERAAAATHAALHPTGQCSCSGEGTCEWCVWRESTP